MNRDRRTAWGFFGLTLLTFVAMTVGGGPWAYGPQMDAVPGLMAVFTLYYVWKAARTCGRGDRR